MFEERNERRALRTHVRDLISGENVEIVAPSQFQLETMLIDSAFYNYRGREYRFMLCTAREAGLRIA